MDCQEHKLPELYDIVYKALRTLWVKGIDEKGKPFSIGRIRFKPETWEKEKAYMISRRLRSDAVSQPRYGADAD